MWGIIRTFIRSDKLRMVSNLHKSSLSSACWSGNIGSIMPTKYVNLIQAFATYRPLNSSGLPLSFSCSTSSSVHGISKVPSAPISEEEDATSSSISIHDDIDADSDDDSGGDYCCDDEAYTRQPSNLQDEALVRDVKTIVDIFRQSGTNRSEMKNMLEQYGGITASSELVVEILSQLRNDWEAAFTFFLWAGKQPGYAHSVREYHSMISILGKMRKFDTAWTLIHEMRGGTTGSSLLTPQTLLIMIRRYCAVHDVGRAINTFYAHKRFKFDVGIEEFQSLLSALCRYRNVQDAEHMLFCNKTVFPFNAKSFNIILNGWCNVIVSPREAERFWREMSKRGIRHDVISYASIISCYSKASNLNKVLKIFNRMKELKIAPDRKVYNAVIHALAKGRLVKEAINLTKTMEENGIAPNVVTYNSLIKPLCKARKLEEAREVLDEMLQRGMSPSIRTYHAILRILRTGDEVFVLLERMTKMGCPPNNDTHIMLIRKFCRWRQHDNVFKLWSKMSENGINPDRSAYIVLIHGLFLNQKMEEALKYYIEMKEKQLLPEPKTDEMLQAWVSGKQITSPMTDLKISQLDCYQPGKKISQERDFHRQPETRRVVRERGFSLGAVDSHV